MGTGVSPVVGSPARERDPATGRFPAGRPRVPACPPCSQQAFDRVCLRLMRGELWRDVATDEGLSCWAELSEAGQLPANRDRWRAVQEAITEADRAEIRDTGRVLLRTARAELPAIEEESDTPTGRVSRTIRRRAAAEATAGAGLVDPATHGRQAGRQTVQVAVGVTVQDARAVLAQAAAGTRDTLATPV